MAIKKDYNRPYKEKQYHPLKVLVEANPPGFYSGGSNRQGATWGRGEVASSGSTGAKGDNSPGPQVAPLLMGVGRFEPEAPMGGVAGLAGGVAGSLLDSDTKTARKLNNAKRRRKRCFHRVISGLECYKSCGNARVVMLSSTSGDAKWVHSKFRALKEWLRRRGVLLAGEYIQCPELTDSGLVHKHIIFRGSYLDVYLLSRKWEALTGAKIVYIQKWDGRKWLAHYLAKYMAKTSDERLHYSWGWGWVWKGFVKDWRRLIKVWRCANNGWDDFAWLKNGVRGWDIPFKGLLAQWRWHLQAGIPP